MLFMDDAKIQQYLLLAKSTKGRGLADLIVKATEDPGLFAFAELLATPSVQEVRGAALPASCAACAVQGSDIVLDLAPTLQLKKGEHALFVALLELFCYGTWAHAQGESLCALPHFVRACSCMQHVPSPPLPLPPLAAAQQAALPPLSHQQKHKLKQLTVVSLAADQKVGGGPAVPAACCHDCCPSAGHGEPEPWWSMALCGAGAAGAGVLCAARCAGHWRPARAGRLSHHRLLLHRQACGRPLCRAQVLRRSASWRPEPRRCGVWSWRAPWRACICCGCLAAGSPWRPSTCHGRHPARQAGPAAALPASARVHQPRCEA